MHKEDKNGEYIGRTALREWLTAYAESRENETEAAIVRSIRDEMDKAFQDAPWN